MIDSAGFQAGWTWIARVLSRPWGVRQRRRLPGIECLSDHMLRDIGVGDATHRPCVRR